MSKTYIMRKIIPGSLLIAVFSAVVIFVCYSPKQDNCSLQNEQIYSIKTKQRVVALTIDDGPDPRFTPPMLDLLKQYNYKATFFMVASNAQKQPDIVKRILSEGHEIGNHTVSHPTLTEMTERGAADEIEEGYRIISEVAGKPPLYFRPPRGKRSNSTDELVSHSGMKQILWKMTVENKSAPTPEAMARRILSQVKPGDIILLHDGRLDRTKTVEALPLILKGLKEKGYKSVTVSQLLEIQNGLEI